MDPSYFRHKLPLLARKAGIAKHISPHTFRHVFSLRLYDKTKDLLLVSKALNHSSIKTTSIHLSRLDNRELLDQLRVLDLD